MKPLSEWTTEELREEIYDGHYDRENMVDELLRRERARCLGVVELTERTLRAFLLDTTDVGMRQHYAANLSLVCSIRDAMRGLK